MRREELLRRYVDLGWALVPCYPRTKRPATPHGYKDATRDLDAILARDREMGARANWAVALEQSGLLVLDFDGEFGARLAALERAYGKFHARAPVAFTPSGGMHVYFRVNDALPTTRDYIGEGIETRCRGAMVLLPISATERGEYRWYRAPWDVEIPPAPWWIVDALRRREERAGDARAQRRIEGIVRFLSRAREGQRNNALYWSARRLREMNVPVDRALHLLLPIAQSTGLDEREITRSIRSAYGL